MQRRIGQAVKSMQPIIEVLMLEVHSIVQYNELQVHWPGLHISMYIQIVSHVSDCHLCQVKEILDFSVLSFLQNIYI